MPDYPRISQLPGFIPASEAPARVLEIFTDAAANEAFIRKLSRLGASYGSVAQTQPDITPNAEPAQKGA